MDRLKGKVAMITGAASGLGLAMARRFTEEGAKIIVNDVSGSAAEATAKELGGHAVPFDVSDSAAVTAGFKEVAAMFGRLDVLVNNAGIAPRVTDEERAERERLTMELMGQIQSGGPVTTFIDTTVNMTDDEWRTMLAIHLDGTFFCTREALKIMNPQMSGSVINLGSIMGTAGGAGAPAYCAAKAAIMGFTRAIARELVLRNIRVNALAPGFIETPMTDTISGLSRTLIVESTPMRRFGEPDDIAWAAVYLASEESKFMTGQVISPNGGYHMSQ